MPGFNLANYDTVDSRIHKFWEDHPDGRILTDIISHSPTDYIVSAAVYRTPRDQRPASTGLAQETVTATGVNKTAALENCETSAIGRALANLGYSTRGQRPSREEMEKVERLNAPDDAELANIADEIQTAMEAAADIEALDKAMRQLAVSPLDGDKRDALRTLAWARRAGMETATT